MDWLLRLEANPDDKALRAELDTWLGHREANAEAFDDMKRVWSRLDALADRPDESPGAALPGAGQAARQVAPSPARRARGGRLRRPAMILAAAIAACIAIVFLPDLRMRLAADLTTGVAEVQTMTLEDGSVALLDARSAVAVDYTPSRREIVLLAGNAFFDVVSLADRPFVVRAADVTVTVTGTGFAVQTAPDQVSVSVQSGTVRVATRQGEISPALLTRGQRLTIDRHSRRETRSEVAPDEVASWRAGRLVVHDARLGSVVEEIGRYYGGMIVFRDRALADQLVTGVFDLRHPVEALAAAIDTQGGKIRTITPYVLFVSAK